jgi:Ubiquitin-like modifier-activating enzyme ATG7 N-terminus
MVAMLDTCSHDRVLGWPLRNLLAALAVQYPAAVVQVLAVRYEHGVASASRSLLLEVCSSGHAQLHACACGMLFQHALAMIWPASMCIANAACWMWPAWPCTSQVESTALGETVAPTRRRGETCVCDETCMPRRHVSASAVLVSRAHALQVKLPEDADAAGATILGWDRSRLTEVRSDADRACMHASPDCACMTALGSACGAAHALQVAGSGALAVQPWAPQCSADSCRQARECQRCGEWSSRQRWTPTRVWLRRRGSTCSS